MVNSVQDNFDDTIVSLGRESQVLQEKSLYPLVIGLEPFNVLSEETQLIPDGDQHQTTYDGW